MTNYDGYWPQPGPVPPQVTAPRPRRAGWIVGGVSLVVVIALAAAGVGWYLGRQGAPMPGTVITPLSPSPAATATTASPLPNLETMPHITVSGSPQNQGQEPLDAADLAPVQRFADDLADANLDAIVTGCWWQPADELRPAGVMRMLAAVPCMPW